jgi:hypothetical protein
MFPKPIAEPAAAKIKPHFDEKESLIALIVAFSPVFLQIFQSLLSKKTTVFYKERWKAL